MTNTTETARAVPAQIPVASPPRLAPLSRAPQAARNPAASYLASLAPGGGRRTMRGLLEGCAASLSGGRATVRTFPWASLRYEHMAAIRSMLADKYAASSANTALAALRGVLKNAFLLGLIGGDDYQRARAVPPVKGSRLPSGRALEAGEVAALINACDSSPAGARDRAALALMFSAGLRRSEACSVTMDAFCRETGAIRVIGKGNKERVVWLTNGARLAVDAWLQLRGDSPGPILAPVSRWQEVKAGKPMGTQSLMARLRLRCDQAGVKRCSPHDLRRSFVSGLLEAGEDLSSVQKLAGHASPVTTARYDRRGEEALRRAAASLHFPYVPPAQPRQAGA